MFFSFLSFLSRFLLALGRFLGRDEGVSGLGPSSWRPATQWRAAPQLELALAKGKKAHDKRETIKERDWKREQQRLLRDRG